MSKWLTFILSGFVGKISGSHIKNSEDFILKIKNLNLQGRVMVSFDVSSIFTNVAIGDTLDFLEAYLIPYIGSLPVGLRFFFSPYSNYVGTIIIFPSTIVFINNFLVCPWALLYLLSWLICIWSFFN